MYEVGVFDYFKLGTSSRAASILTKGKGEPVVPKINEMRAVTGLDYCCSVKLAGFSGTTTF